MTMLACTNFTAAGPFAQFCPSDRTPGSGNVDRPAGVAVASPAGGNAYALVVNPDMKQARAADLTDGLMVPAPNVYFPMAVKLGTYSEHIAASEDGVVAVVLDAADQTLKFFRVGPVSDAETWRQIGDVVAVDARPTALAVHGKADGLTVAVAHAGAPDGSLTLLRWDINAPVANRVTEKKSLVLHGRPSGVGLSEDGQTVVVTNVEDNPPFAMASDIFILDVTTPLGTEGPFPVCQAGTRPCVLNTGGRSNHVTVGTVPTSPASGAPRYPVALVTHVDEPLVSVVRLQTSGAADALAARVTMPRPPVASALAPAGAPLCCVGGPFSNDPSSLGEGGFAYAVVAQGDGSIAYLDLDARGPDGQRTPRVIDRNPAAPAPAVADINAQPELYREPDQTAGVSPGGTRPVVRLQVQRDWSGNPPLVNQWVDADYVFTWQGVLPGLDNRRGSSTAEQLSQGVLEDQDGLLNLGGQGVLPGDVVQVPLQPGCACPLSAPGCINAAELTIVAVSGATLGVEDSFAVRECLGQAGGFAYRVRARNAWVVVGGTVSARVRYFEPLDAPGVRISLLPAGSALTPDEPVVTRDPSLVPTAPSSLVVVRAPPTDTQLLLPMRSNFDAFVLDADDTDAVQGRFTPANAIPTGLVTAAVPVLISTTTGTASSVRHIGVLSTAGGGLIMQFDLGIHPTCSATAPGCPALLSRGVRDDMVRFYE
jgi:hypothetical protein